MDLHGGQGEKLLDKEIDFSQYLLKCQFPKLKGVQLPLLTVKETITNPW